MEELLSTHRKQLRDLQSQITQKKKSATKKTRRGVNDECERLERELKERQRNEVIALDAAGGKENLQNENGDITTTSDSQKADGGEIDLDTLTLTDDDDDGVNGTTTTTSNLNTTTTTTKPSQSLQPPPPTTDPSQSTTPPSSQPPQKKPSRQKARLARRAAEISAQTSAAQSEASQQPDHRGLERAAMSQLLTSLSLSEREIRSDGHCMYSAVAHSLNSTTTSSQPYTYATIRARTADYISAHRSDYEPFIDDDAGFESYVRKIRSTAEWGGELELSAIAKWTGRKVVVVQSEGGVREIDGGGGGGEGDAAAAAAARPESDTATDPDTGTGSSEPIYLSYYRRSFGLGEHYNALEKTTKNTTTTVMKE